MISPLLHTAARLLLPAALLVAAHLLFRGHNLPGGGFVAGLMTAAALILQFVAADRRVAEQGLPWRPEALIWFGLALATLTAVVPLAFGHGLLTSGIASANLPLLGYFKLSTALFFDLGVFFVVTGITLAILIAIED